MTMTGAGQPQPLDSGVAGARASGSAPWSQVEAVLAAALEHAPDARHAFMEAACAGDQVLRAEVAALLAASERTGPVDAPAAWLSEMLGDGESVTQATQLEPGHRLGPYVVVSHLGAGGMGQVYRARDTRLDRDVAIKIVAPHLQPDATSRARLEREARVIASLSHPNVLAIFDIGDHNGMVYVVTELLTGRTVREMLESDPLDEHAVIDLMCQAARGLGAAHARHVVHRDLKPENLFVTDAGVVKILDFGLAKPQPDDADRPAQAITSAFAVVGTIGYMSPEQIVGGPVDARSDLFSLGAVLYEAAAGTRAFSGSTRSEIAAAILAAPPSADLTRISPRLSQAIMRCLARSPADRYQSAADLAFTLQLLASPGVTRLAPGSAQPLAHVPRNRRLPYWALAATAAIALAIVAGVVVQTRRASFERPVTFVVHAPKGTSFNEVTMEPRPAVSPDGRRLVFRALAGSQSLLFVQTLGELEARPLTGTYGTSFPFWSPDGAFIGFGTQERLRKVSASGDRAPQDICVCDARFGGAWGREGTVLFAGATGVFRVSSNGGPVTPVTRLDQSRDEFSHRFPVLLPDGKRFLYLVRSTRDDYRGVYMASLDDPSLKQRLLADDSNVAYSDEPSGSGHLFFVRDRVLLAQKFDASRGEFQSDPVVVARPVVPGEAGRFAPFAVGARSLVYRLRSRPRTPLHWTTRNGVTAGRIGSAEANYRYPSLSPDGTKIAVMIGDTDTDKPDVWVLDLARQVHERLTRDPVGAWFPQWMPDGQHVVFASARQGIWRTYRQSITDNRSAPLDDERDPWGQYPTAVTRDGRFIVAEAGRSGIWLLPLTGRDRPQRLLDGWHGRVSSNGGWLAYTADGTGASEVYVTSFPTPSRHWRISTNGGYDPQWRQDGRELYYVARDNTLMAVPVRTSAQFEFDAAQPLFPLVPDSADLGGLGSIYVPAADGQRFIVTESAKADSPVGVDEMLLRVTMNWQPSAP